jgi:5'-nucleotidase
MSNIEVFHGHQVAFAKKDDFMKKMSHFAAQGAGSLRVVSDFDFTMSKFLMNGKRGASCHRVIEDCGLLSPDYHVQAQGLQAKYYPMEVDPNLDMEEKTRSMIEWVDQAHVLLVQYGLARSTISKAVSEAVQTQRFGLRENLDEFLSLLAESKVPTLIFSAGIADVLEEVLRTQVASLSWDRLHVISNRCIYHEDSEQVQSFVQPLLHVFNKRSSAYLHTDYFKIPDLPSRQCLLLLGDSLGDVTMAEGMGIPEENILKVGFLNDRPERLPQYLECFDLVILDDPGFDIPIKIVEEITRGVAVL